MLPGIVDDVAKFWSGFAAIFNSYGPENKKLLAKGAERDVSEIVRAANQRLAPHQQIRRQTVWPEDSFPLTPTLKVKRVDVAETLAQMHAGPGATTVGTT